MPSVYDLKPAFQSLLRPAVRFLAGCGVTANQVTVFAVGVSAAQGSFLASAPDSIWPLVLLPFVLFVRMALNAIDGMLAREFDQKSRLGAVLNELGDVIGDAVLYLPLAMLPEVHPVPIVLFVLLAVVSEFAGVVAIQIGARRRYDGPMGKSDRAFWIGLSATLLAAGWLSPFYLAILFWVFVALSILTVIHRLRRALVVREPIGVQTTETLMQT